MRRFLIWSALAVVVGLAIAAGGYWAYWNFHARYQPVTITRNQAEIQRLLDEASWLSAGGGGEALYIVGYRDCASCLAYEESEAPKLRAAGVEVRVIVFARPDREGLAQSTAAERATVAELWLTRDWSLYQRWTATPSRDWSAAGIPPADGNLARTAVVGAGREFVEELSGLLRGAGMGVTYPLVIWRDREGFLKACACSSERSWAFIRDDLDAPDRLRDPEPGAPLPDAAAGAPYPGDPGAAEVEQPAPTPSPIDPAPAASAPPPRATPSRPPQPREAPQPSREEEAVFF